MIELDRMRKIEEFIALLDEAIKIGNELNAELDEITAYLEGQVGKSINCSLDCS